MRVYLEPSAPDELDQPVDQLLGKLVKAFEALGEQLIKATPHDTGEIDALTELREQLETSYQARLDTMMAQILAVADDDAPTS